MIAKKTKKIKHKLKQIPFSLVPKTIKSKFPSNEQQNRQNHSGFSNFQGFDLNNYFPCPFIFFRFSETFARQQRSNRREGKNIHERMKQELRNEIARKWERILQQNRKRISRESQICEDGSDLNDSKNRVKFEVSEWPSKTKLYRQ